MNIIKIKQFLVVVASLCLSAWARADTYTYDNLNRLTSVVYSSGPQISYSYDAAGNRTTMNSSAPTAPAITSAGTASGTVNQSFSYQIAATNNPTSYGASGLPAGLSVNPSTGLISGTPTASGTYIVTVTATNAGGMGSMTLTLTVTSTGTLITRYRLYSDGTKEHLYTTDANEYSVLPMCCGWLAEGAIYKLFQGPGSLSGVAAVPYYRLYNPSSHQHHWTTDLNEYNVLGSRGWTKEGVDGYILPTAVAGTLPLYRLYFNAFGGLHLWTVDANEKTVLTTTAGWVNEGVAGYVVPLP